MKTHQAEVFGFPNSLIGIAGFAIIVTIGMALLAGATLKRWFWRGLGIGTLLALVFIYWLFFQSVFQIHALCLYCMIVWTVTIPIFLYSALYGLEQGHIPMPKAMAEYCHRHHLILLSIGYLIIVISILVEFWKYWKLFI